AFFLVAAFITMKAVFFYSEFSHDIHSPEKTNYLFSVVGLLALQVFFVLNYGAIIPFPGYSCMFLLPFG
ncbi:hypothetical protein, partial [Candidatus Kuenenia stuttgartiensis]|uniref:hypothetical protein n=1 Tax=Kuenenia stuttgartiensis TaxID=174633 RepID=UPI001B8D0B3C